MADMIAVDEDYSTLESDPSAAAVPYGTRGALMGAARFLASADAGGPNAINPGGSGGAAPATEPFRLVAP
jgi:hypothetical protein